MNPGLSLIVPVYNEEAGLKNTIVRLLAVKEQSKFPMELIFVNDGSTDRSPQILKEVGGDVVTVLNHITNHGYGASLKTGIGSSKYDCVAITDADGTYPIERILEFYQNFDEHGLDMLVGARINKNVQIPMVRRPPKWFLNQLANVLINEKIPDLNSGFRFMRKSVVNSFFYLLPNGFSFTSTITLAMLHCNFKVHFLSIDYLARSGKSKIRPFYDSVNFFLLIVRTAVYFNPIRFFFPITFVMFALSLVSLGLDILGANITDSTVLLLVASLLLFVFTLISDQLNNLRKEIVYFNKNIQE